MVPVSWRSALSMRSSRTDRSPGSASRPDGACWRDCGSPRLNRSSRKFPDPRCCAGAGPARSNTEIAATAAVEADDRERVMVERPAAAGFPIRIPYGALRRNCGLCASSRTRTAPQSYPGRVEIRPALWAFPECQSIALRTDAEHGHGAAVLRPAGDVITDRDRPLLAVRNCPHPLTLDSTRDQIVAHRLRTTCAERDIVFARPTLVGVSLDRELRILTVVGEPLRLLVKSRARLRRQFGRIGFEEDAVADIDDEVLLAARRRLPGRVCLGVLAPIGTSRNRKCCSEDRGEAGNAQHSPHVDHFRCL